MTRMTREFSFVLLGSGVLTTGYFLAPSPDAAIEQNANELAAEQVGAGTRDSNGHYRPHSGLGMGYAMLFLHSRGYAGGSYNGRPMATSSVVSRGGFGTMGRSASVSS